MAAGRRDAAVLRRHAHRPAHLPRVHGRAPGGPGDELEDAAARIATWYGTELPARGWELEKQSDAAGSHLVIAHKAGRKATVLITGGPQGSQILLTVLEER